jgi:aspartate/methionine/tyrosine aminotransferase
LELHLIYFSIPKAQKWGRNYLAALGSKVTPDNSLLDLSQGVPLAAPHPSVLEALARVSADPQAAKYGPIMGQPALREALANETRALYQIASTSTSSITNTNGTVPAGANGDSLPTVTAEDVGITTGCNMAFLLLLMVLCPPGSSVLLPYPAYFNHYMSLSFQSLHPAWIPCDPQNAFRPSLEVARQLLENPEHERRAIVLVTPNNPTGLVLSPDELKQWYDLAREFEVALILDETYRDFVEAPEGRGVPHRLFEDPDWRGTLISLGSFSSKSLPTGKRILTEIEGYKLPGHRLGSIICSPQLLQQITTIGDCMQVSRNFSVCKPNHL